MKYDVYSIGTALIDFEFKLTENDPLAIELDRGGTRLLNANDEALLLKKLSHLTPHRACGGSGANTLSLIRQLGGNVFHTCKVGKDAEGDFYFMDLNTQGIQSNLNNDNRGTLRTGKCIVVVTEDADRALHTFLGANTELSPTDLNAIAMANAKYLFIEAFLWLTPSARATAIKAKELAQQYSIKTAITLSTCRAPLFSQELVYDAARDADILFCNESEAAFFCGSTDLSDIQIALKKYAKQFVITRGEKGVLIFDGKNTFDLPAVSAKAVDTTGAGDAFAGAFLHGITHGMDFITAGEFANLMASKSILQIGPRLRL